MKGDLVSKPNNMTDNKIINRPKVPYPRSSCLPDRSVTTPKTKMWKSAQYIGRILEERVD